MEFVLMSSDRLKIILSRPDMEELGVDSRSMDYADRDTRRVLVSLLERGRAETGFNPKKSKLYIEVYPSEDDGCVICYTSIRAGDFPSAPGIARAPCPVVFRFEDIETLTTASLRVYERYSHRIWKSSLYQLDKSFRLIIWPLDYADRLSVLFLSEYAPVSGEGEVLASFIEEHGDEVIRDEALDLLARYFS